MRHDRGITLEGIVSYIDNAVRNITHGEALASMEPSLVSIAM
jgi:hypothetical protein